MSKQISLVDVALEWAGNQVALASRYQAAGFPTVRQQTISKWKKRNGIPAEWAEATELATRGFVKAGDVFRQCQRKPVARSRRAG